MSYVTEPTITVNGVTLTTGQAMTMRVALDTWAMELRDDPGCLGVDEHARHMRNGYLAAIRDIQALILRG